MTSYAVMALRGFFSDTLYSMLRQRKPKRVNKGKEKNMPTALTNVLLIVAVILVFLIGLILAGYVKAPPDMAFIISGAKKKPKVLIGRAGIKIPLFERLDKLYLGQISVDIKTDTYIPTNDFING